MRRDSRRATGASFRWRRRRCPAAGAVAAAVAAATAAAVGLDPLVAGQVQPPPGDVPAVQQAHRAGRRVAGIRVELLAGRFALLVQGREHAAAHVRLRPYQQPRRRSRRQPQRQRADRPRVDRHEIPDPAVAARRRLGQHAVLVEQRERHAVDLQLADEVDLRVRHQPLEPPDPFLEFAVVVGVVEREHRRLVFDLLEALGGLAAHPLRRAVGGTELRVLLLDRRQLRHQAVELPRDLGLRCVVAVGVRHRRPWSAELRVLLGSIAARELRHLDEHALRGPGGSNCTRWGLGNRRQIRNQIARRPPQHEIVARLNLNSDTSDRVGQFQRDGQVITGLEGLEPGLGRSGDMPPSVEFRPVAQPRGSRSCRATLPSPTFCRSGSPLPPGCLCWVRGSDMPMQETGSSRS